MVGEVQLGRGGRWGRGDISIKDLNNTKKDYDEEIRRTKK